MARPTGGEKTPEVSLGRRFPISQVKQQAEWQTYDYLRSSLSGGPLVLHAVQGIGRNSTLGSLWNADFPVVSESHWLNKV